MIVDGTLGGGGHAEALLDRGARVLGLDRDPKALAAATARLARFEGRFQARQGDYADALALAGGPVDGLLLDLGVSSPQLDDAARGFSFTKDGPLDMRMGGQGRTAAELIAETDERELADLIYAFGEERFSRQIARALKAAAPRTTLEAAKAVEAAVPRKLRETRIHPATRTFQALRIAVNQELRQLESTLQGLDALLRPGGRAAIISFHSLEDRLVKQAFRRLSGGEDPGPRGLPLPPGPPPRFRLLTKKALVASEAEVAANPRARSAKLRGLEKAA